VPFLQSLPPVTGDLIQGIGIGVGASAAGIGWLVKLLKSAGSHQNGNGSLDWRTHITTAVSALTAAVATIGEQTGDVRDTVRHVDARLATMPTREDLAAVAKENRHAARNDITPLTAAVSALRARFPEKGSDQ